MSCYAYAVYQTGNLNDNGASVVNNNRYLLRKAPQLFTSQKSLTINSTTELFILLHDGQIESAHFSWIDPNNDIDQEPSGWQEVHDKN